MHLFKNLMKFLAVLLLSLSLTAAFSACGSAAPSASSGGAKTSASAKGGSQLTVRMLDIGQGDAFLLEKDGKFVMIDTGDIEHRDQIVALLHKYKVKEISKIIITHPHADHLGGMNAIFKNFKVDAIYDDGMPAGTGSYKNYLKQIKEKKIPYHVLKAGDEVDFFDGVKFNVLGPVKVIKDQKGNSDFNNNSIVGRLTYGSFSMMFTGDAEQEEEKTILGKGGTLKSDVLKVGHHGSRTSSSPAFLKAVSPKNAFISCGQGNDYGHPHKVTIDKLEKAKVQIYRTDRNGTVTLTSDGSSYRIEKERN
ncbi:ComEC/Rec2 family competence protein [uncultured Dialister sp.]|mgnify:FL=1|uniref:ComEC/Rec2 family competence protein n=1 Tax=uncultured Dialister sp. TaxID=278064 RepID=UPI0025E35DF7|nr:ComEC/Rec2 family competence protein [uncultured Dialister sp.]